MRVKRYVAETLQDAMLKVKMDMGKDAVILHTRKFKEGGFFGFFGKVRFEVTAAVEEARPAQNPAPAGKPAQDMPGMQGKMGTGRMTAITMEEPAETSEEEHDLHEELQEMKDMLSEVMNQIDMAQDIKSLPKPVQRFHQILTDNDVDDRLTKKMLQNILKQIPREEIGNSEIIRKSLEKQVLRLLKKPRPVSFKRQALGQQSIVLVGPTGVGKTTTIAKLAATFSIIDQKKVALITADTYRVAAVEQLKTYGEIIGIPVDVVYTPQELQKAIARHTDKDLVLIDTAGRSHKNDEQMSELRTFLEIAEPSDVFLVLSATTRYRDMMDIVNSYGDIPVSRLVFTKLDETSTYGPILNVVSSTQKHLSYVTVGQNVPDDIEIADPSKIANMIMRER
ncbi:flagellar biosynthesis protein FlhF [Phosphitispora fastidiosa]|uniref:flagellar biosynthesis protein FlhF n=1 Tax=Phosphitispora fastidiosa TaxID=2837202 RepID=UPI001E5BD8BE|nr:flagellar biosynthesis protein FlhF [Phosphitispora fastidiosa]